MNVTLGATDANYVELSEDVSFLTPTAITYTTSPTHTFTGGDGVKTLYARFADNLGLDFPAVMTRKERIVTRLSR